jgi:hypothetical protein
VCVCVLNSRTHMSIPPFIGRHEYIIMGKVVSSVVISF